MSGRDLALLVGTLVLAAGTYAMRAGGVLLRSRLDLGPAARTLLERATVVLLTALVATAALLANGHAAGIARPAGVLVGGVLAWRRAPFVVVVVAAAATAALLRAAGVR